MPDMLTNDPNRADALLDMSNVLRNSQLGGRGPAELIRLERVGEALANLYGAAKIAMFGIADRSLLTQSDLFLDRWQRRTLRDWERSGLILVAGKADVPLLQAAHETGLPIITGDRFVGHRREFPWLDGSDDAILEPQASRYGDVSLRHVTLTRRDEWEISRSEERDLLKQQGLTRHVKVLGRYWSCPNRAARGTIRRAARSCFCRWRRATASSAISTSSTWWTRDLGRGWPSSRSCRTAGNGIASPSFRTNPDIAGRFPGPADLSPFLDETTWRGVSRSHLRFDLDAEGLTVTDVSLNGTWLFLRDGTRLNLRHATHPFTVGDRAQIQPSLEIIRSGRRYPSELSADRLAARQLASEPPPTVWVRKPH